MVGVVLTMLCDATISPFGVHQTPCTPRANIWPSPGYGGALLRLGHDPPAGLGYPLGRTPLVGGDVDGLVFCAANKISNAVRACAVRIFHLS